MLDVRRLQMLNAVVSAGSITGAAAALGYTASAVSQSVAALERESGAVLLEKVGRGVRPTQAGLLLAEHGGAVLDRLSQAEAALHALQSGQAGHLRLAAFATAGAALVPRALARFRQLHAQVKLDLVVAETDEALAQLHDGSIDLAVIVFDGDGGAEDLPDDLSHVPLLIDPYRLTLPRSHRLANKRTVALEDLADDDWIATSSLRCSCVAVMTAACERAGFTPRLAIEADEFATALGFVSAGIGVALMPSLALGSVPDDVRVRRLRDDAPVRNVVAVTRRSAAAEQPVRSMLDALAASARSYRA